MSTFGSGSTTTAGASITLTAFEGTNGVKAGTDGLVPGPSIAQGNYLLGANGDWTLNIKGGIALAESSDRIATTEFVQDVVGNAVLAGNAQISALADVTIAALADDQFLQYNPNGLGNNKWNNVTLNLATIADVDLTNLADGNALVYDATANNNAGGWIPGGGGGGGAATLNGLGDVTINGDADKHFLVRNGAGQYVNRLISTADLSDEADLVLETRGATFGAFDYDFTGANSITVKAPVGANDATTKTYVDTQVATKQPIDATLTALAGVATVADKLIYATNVDTFATTDLTAFGRTLIANANAGDARTDLNLGTASQSNVGDFLASNSSVDDLNDVTLGALAVNQMLVYTGGVNGFENQTISSSILTDSANIPLLNANQTFTGTVEATTQLANDNSTKLATTEYTDRQVSDEITALNLGTASQSNVGDFLPANTSINDLNDVDTAGNVDGKILKFNAQGNLVVGDDLGKTEEEIQDFVGTMFTANNAGNTLITFAYDDTGGVNDGTITATVSLASTDLTDTANVSLLNANQTITGDKTFNGAVDLTGATATGATPAASDNSTSLATTAYVDNQIDVDIQALNLAGTYQPINARLTDISGLAPTANNFIVGDGNNFTLETPTDVITSLGMGVALNDLLIGSGANTFTTIATTAGSRSFLASDAGLNDLANVTLGGVALAEGQVLRVSADNTTLINAVLSFDDLSDTGNVVKTDAGATFGAFAYDFTASTVTVKAPNGANDATTKTYVDTTRQPLDATLTELAGLNTGVKQLIYSTANDALEMTSLSDNAKTFIASSVGVSDLSDVLIAGVGDAHILVYDDDLGQDDDKFKNVAISGDVTISNAGVVSIGEDKVTNTHLEKTSITVGSTVIQLGSTSTTLEGMTGIDFTAANASIGANIGAKTLTLGGNTSTVSVANNLTVSGTLTVSGATTTLDTTNLSVKDAVIELAKDADQAVRNADLDTGIVFTRGSNVHPAVFFWDEDDQKFVLATKDGASTSTTNFSADNPPVEAQLDVGTFNADIITMDAADATSLVFNETGGDTFLTFNTAVDKIVFGKIFEATTASKIGDIEISNGQIQTTALNNNLSFNDNNLLSTGTANFGGTTVDSLDASSGGITNAGAISGVSSLAGSDLDLNLTDDEATAFEVKGDVKAVGTNSYLTFVTTDNSEEVVFNQGGVDIDFRVEGEAQTHLLYADATNDRVGINTDTPSTQFHVAGDTKLVGGLSHSVGAVAFNTGLGNFDFRVAGDNQANLLFVDASTDRIGVHTDTPSETLDVVGTVGISSTLDVTGKTTLAGSLDLTTGSATGITFRSEIADNGADADQTLLRVNMGGGGPVYKSIKWVAASDLFEVESGLKSTGNFTVGADLATINATTGVTSIKGATTINNAGGTSDLIIQNNGADVLNVDVSAGLTTITGIATVSSQLKTDDLRGLTAGTGNFKVRLEDNVANALEISDATNALSFMTFTTTDDSESITLAQDAIFKKAISIENTNTNGLFFNSNRSAEVSEDATLITVEGGSNKNDVVLAWDTSDNALNLNAESQVHLQGRAGLNALTIGGALVDNSTIVMTTAGAITLDGTLDSPTINTDKITNKNDTSLVVELADTEASALVIRQGADQESYLTINTDALTTTFNQAVNFDASATFDTTVEVTGITTLNDSLKVNKAGSDTGIIFNADRGGAEDINAQAFDATLLHVEDGGSNATDAYLKWDDSESSFKIEGGKLFSATEISVGTEVNNALTKNFTVGTDGSVSAGAMTATSPADASNTTAVATTEWVRDRKLGDFAEVDTSGFNANDQILVWDEDTSTFKMGSAVYAKENAIDDVGQALIDGSLIKDGADGGNSGADTIQFTLDDANDIINLALGISSGNLTDISTDAPADNQILRFTTAEGDDQNKYVPTTLGTAADVDTGLDNGEIPTLSTHYLANQSETADLIITGRVVESIDYGSVAEAFNANDDFALDFNGTGLDDAVLYCEEDYGVLVV